MRYRHAKPDRRSDNLLTLPDILFQLKRMFGTPVNAEVTAQELNDLLLVGERFADEDIFPRQ